MQNPNTIKADLSAYIEGWPKRFENVGFKNFIEKNDAQKNAKLLCKGFFNYESEKKGLFFYGPVGTGKTHLAIATLRNLKPQKNGEYMRRATARILNADEFFMILNDAVSERKSKLGIIKSLLETTDVLCLDDLGTKNFTEAKQENLYALINHAYLNLRKIIITTNFTLDDLAKFDERIASRISEMCQLIFLSGEDHRLKT